MKKIIDTLVLCLILFLTSGAALAAAAAPPANTPGEIQFLGNRILWKYDGGAIFEAVILTGAQKYRTHVVTEDRDGRITQLLILTARDGKDTIDLQGTLTASLESFACEADRPARGLPAVRHSIGLSRSLLNRGVYDRARDWVLSVDHNPQVKIVPLAESATRRSFQYQISGREVVLRFRPRFYQKHRGLSYYEPWNYRVWDRPIVGWCSWFAYLDDIDEQKIKKTADVLAAVLVPFGYEYLQIDDGYQRGQGLPELWLQPNEKFPSGLKTLAEYIKSKGLKPGIWTNVAFNQMDFAEKNPSLFVLDESGRPARGNWIDISLDGSSAKALDLLIRPVYRGLKDMGWEYFKVDALRHLRYEGYNSHPEYFRKKGVDRVEAFRSVARSIREEIGRERFMLGCWGIRPELIGIIDGCRIGTDGYSFAGLSQYNSFNNVVWRNDPDHIELSPEEAYRSTMTASLTGSLFLLTDKPEVYLTSIVDPAKRAAPVPITYPGQLYDVDPSRSAHLDRVDIEVSGSGPRVFDATQDPKVHFYLLEVNKDFESWLLLGRTGGDADSIAFADLGLDPDEEYFVFDFWSKRLLGSFKKSFSPGQIDPRFRCQLFCIRKRLDRPQLIATNRHITCGGYDLESVEWKENALSGRSRLVGKDTYTLYVALPEKYAQPRVSCGPEAQVLKTEKKGAVLFVNLRAEKNTMVSWNLQF